MRMVSIYKTHNVGKTEVIFTSGIPNPLNLDCRDRRFIIFNRQLLTDAIVKSFNDTTKPAPPNTRN